MAKTVFFSWQSDTPSNVGRGFLKDVLNEVCKNLANETDVNEAHRDMEVDSDTQGVAGQPPIVDTIFNKIDTACVFVADMTFTGTRIDKRPTPNPNVLIEYGWALKSLTHQRVICVMNDAYGEPSHDSLPFDLSHLRWPIRYSLSNDATPDVKKVEKQKLIATLTSALKASLATVPVVPVKEVSPFPLAQALADRARFRGPNQALGFEYDNFHHEEPKEVFLNNQPATMWLRIMPINDTGKTWSPHEIKPHLLSGGGIRLPPFNNGAGGYGQLRSEDGVGIYRGKPQNEGATTIETDSVAFIFTTGEIWSVDTSYLMYGGSDRLPFVEDLYVETAQSYISFLKSLGLEPPFKWMAGMIGIKGRHLQYPVQQGYGRVGTGPVCASSVITAEGQYDNEEDLKKSLMPFFKKIFEQCGLARPSYLPEEQN